METATLLNDQIHISALKAIARQFVDEIFAEGRLDTIDELVDPEFVSRTFGITEDGPAQLKVAAKRVHDSLSNVEFRIDDMVTEGDRVAVRLTSSATPRGEYMGVDARGKRYTIEEMHVFRIVDGLVVEHWHSHDALGILRQIGAFPQ